MKASASSTAFIATRCTFSANDVSAALSESDETTRDRIVARNRARLRQQFQCRVTAGAYHDLELILSTLLHRKMVEGHVRRSRPPTLRRLPSHRFCAHSPADETSWLSGIICIDMGKLHSISWAHEADRGRAHSRGECGATRPRLRGGGLGAPKASVSVPRPRVPRGRFGKPRGCARTRRTRLWRKRQSAENIPENICAANPHWPCRDRHSTS